MASNVESEDARAGRLRRRRERDRLRRENENAKERHGKFIPYLCDMPYALAYCRERERNRRVTMSESDCLRRRRKQERSCDGNIRTTTTAK